MTKRLLVLVAVASILVASAIGGSASSIATTKDVFLNATVGPRGTVDSPTGGEPSIANAPDGTLYISYPGGMGMGFYRSVNDGLKWVAGAIPDPDSGDTTVNVDSSGAVYQSNLRGIPAASQVLTGPSPLQIDLYKSLDGGKSWPQKGVSGASDSSTNSRFLVDRQWVDAYIPPGKTSNDALVYIAYHDWVAGVMWVNASKDGGKTFGDQINIMTNPVALANGFCNVVPGSLKVVQSGPHAGRVYVVWLSGSVAENAPTGCNYTQMATFGQVWSAYSDDQGATWTDRLVYDSGLIGHDACAIFADMALDVAGNPYVAFALNDADMPHTGGEGDQWNIFVSASLDGGQTWNGASDGSGTPYKVTSASGTHVFPAITAGDVGRVAVAYLGTDSLIPQLPYGKPVIGGDPSAKWNVFAARSIDLASGHPTWTTNQLTTKPMHTGDVCTLGIFCISELGSDRSLLDFIDIVGDPDGMLHVAYTDTDISEAGAVRVSNQIAGVPLIAPKLVPKPKPPLPIPHIRRPVVLGEKLAGTGIGLEAPFIGILLLAAAAIAIRRLRRTA
jgi:hypothetical protein